MKVEVDIDEDDGTVCITVDPAGEWSYRDEYGRFELTVKPPTQEEGGE